jgi:hypothetical protein
MHIGEVVGAQSNNTVDDFVVSVRAFDAMATVQYQTVVDTVLFAAIEGCPIPSSFPRTVVDIAIVDLDTAVSPVIQNTGPAQPVDLTVFDLDVFGTVTQIQPARSGVAFDAFGTPRVPVGAFELESDHPQAAHSISLEKGRIEVLDFDCCPIRSVYIAVTPDYYVVGVERRTVGFDVFSNEDHFTVVRVVDRTVPVFVVGNECIRVVFSDVIRVIRIPGDDAEFFRKNVDTATVFDVVAVEVANVEV